MLGIHMQIHSQMYIHTHTHVTDKAKTISASYEISPYEYYSDGCTVCRMAVYLAGSALPASVKFVVTKACAQRRLEIQGPLSIGRCLFC